MSQPTQPTRPLLGRRLVIVTGKGGTGKTSVAAALALGAAERGRRVLVAAVDPDARLRELLGGEPAPLVYEPFRVRKDVWVSHIEPFAALGEYLALQIGARRLVEPVLRQQAFRQFLLATPGWRELITLGKVWHYEQMMDGGRPRFDLIVVDAPATGHGLTFLDVPRVVVSAVRAGPMHRHTERVEALIEDPERTVLLPVALAEELPTRETIELVERARDHLSISLDRVVVNAMHDPPYPPGLEDLDRRLARLDDATPLGALPPAGDLAACGAILHARANLNAHFAAELARATGLPTRELPYLHEGLDGPEALARLAGPLLAGEGAA